VKLDKRANAILGVAVIATIIALNVIVFGAYKGRRDAEIARLKTLEEAKIVQVVKEVPAKGATLKWFTETDPTKSLWLAQEYRSVAGVDVEVILTQAPDGTASEIDAMMAAGNMPNVYSAYGGRTSKFYDVSIPINVNEPAYILGILNLCKNSAGQTVAVPYGYWIQWGVLNMDMVHKYHLEQWAPKGEDRTWTIADFEAMATAFRKVAAPDEYAGMVYAASGSGDYWVQLWEKGLGAYPLYNPTTGKLDVAPLAGAWGKFKDYIKAGWFPPGAEGLNDDMYCALFPSGKLLFYGDAPAGAYSRNFEAMLCSYPSLDGSFVPAAIGPSCHVVLQTGDAENDVAAKAFVEWLSGPDQTSILCTGYSPRSDAKGAFNTIADTATDVQKAVFADTEAYAGRVLAKYGVMNTGIGSVKYQAIRTLRAQKLAEALAGKDVGTAVAEFQAEGDAIFAK
jgi:hypothetical protein